MARILPIVEVKPSNPNVTVSLGCIVVAGDLVSSFQGKFYRQNISPFAIAPFYSSLTTPAGYSLIIATTFDIINNPSYNGRYTVYTPASSGDPSSYFSPETGNTKILVNEVVGVPASAGDALAVGSITNISTYIIAVRGETPLIVPPTVALKNRPLAIIGRGGAPWAESYTQNFVKLAQNFAGPSAPPNPYLGQTWYDDASNTFNLRTTSGWTSLGSGASGSNTTFRYTQTVAATTWVIQHNLGLASPFVALIQVFIDVGGVHKMTSPLDITFDDANQMTVSFTTPQSGIALVRS